jgi:molybdenum-dependent DNA-binding transcriptional regulator ModE
LVGSAPCSKATITALHNCISPHKTFQECERKMLNLKGMKKSYGNIFDYLKKMTQLSEEWILEKRKESGYFHISHFQKELMELKESETIEHRALRMFLSNFYHKEAEFHSPKSSLPNIFTNSSSDNLNSLLMNGLNFNDSPSKIIELEIIDPTEEHEKTSNPSGTL